ncbi:PHP domain-containing protein [Tannockella kyphosi]|uniref:PHP domain-containing protein n=1 Tax=Tannockella kyphosi TaxID=2899121 RepID=UPI0020128599|nr:PHP domain-containing protein [Tannockella kyphosi]
MIDGHVHLEYGPLTKEYVLEFVEQAKKMGVTVLHMLDHTHRFQEFAPIYEELKEIPCQKAWLDLKVLEPLSVYHQLIEEIKAMDLEVEVRFGLEVCYVPRHENLIRELVQAYPYDFMIGSVHSIDGKLYDMVFSKEILWQAYDVDAIYKRYYEIIFDLVKSNIFSQLGHVDTVKMFNYYPTYDLTETYHELAKLLVEHHVLAENNSRCHYKYKHPELGLAPDLMKILKEHEVSFIASSDGHLPKEVGFYLKELYQQIEK